MINSYNLSQKNLPKLLIIHGLNNNVECFNPLKQYFVDKGWEVEMVVLPCHGNDRHEARDFKEAFSCFKQEMRIRIQGPYVALAFSHGALYLQLWLAQNKTNWPLRQVLLAPALFIRYQNKLLTLFKWLPSLMLLKSLAPRPFRRYQFLRVWEYRILLDGMQLFQKINPPIKLPTLVLIDPKDELVDALRTKERLIGEALQFEMYPRPYLNKGQGQHHLIFHPEYFSAEDWGAFMAKIETFLLPV